MTGHLEGFGRGLRADSGWLTVGLLFAHAKAVRIPLLIFVLGVVLTFWVEQIHELFLMLVTDFDPRINRRVAYVSRYRICSLIHGTDGPSLQYSFRPCPFESVRQGRASRPSPLPRCAEPLAHGDRLQALQPLHISD
jgi:hypothetical protein